MVRREHAAAELAAKLERRGYTADAVAGEIERLAQAGLQSDERFVEQFVSERVNHGDGPRKIRHRLAERGIAERLATAALEAFADEWSEHAAAALQRRFGEAPPADRGERARRVRFLEQRGFPTAVAARVTAAND